MERIAFTRSDAVARLLKIWSSIAAVEGEAAQNQNAYGNVLLRVPKGMSAYYFTKELELLLDKTLRFRFVGMKHIIRHKLTCATSSNEYELVNLYDKIQDAGRWSNRFRGILQLELNCEPIPDMQPLEQFLSFIRQRKEEIITIFVLSGVNERQYAQIAHTIEANLRCDRITIELDTDTLYHMATIRLAGMNMPIGPNAMDELVAHFVAHNQSKEMDDYDYFIRVMDALVHTVAVNLSKNRNPVVMEEFIRKVEKAETRSSAINQIGFIH